MRVTNLLNLISGLTAFETLKHGSPMTFQMAFHFTLLVDSLDQGNYTSKWKQEVVTAFLEFKKAVGEARIHYRETRESRPHHERFGRLLSGSGSDTAETIRLRHSFMLSEIYPQITTVGRDPIRGFDLLEREVIWNRDRGICQNPGCQLPDRRVNFGSAEIHHIVEHSAGGRTNLKNGILICSLCHSNRAQMQSLTGHFQEYIERIYSGGNSPSPGLFTEDTEPTDTEDSRGEGKGLRITINWAELNVDRATQSIRKNGDPETIVEMLRLLIAEFGQTLEDQFKTYPIIRYPLSADPKVAFLNSSKGIPYSHIPVGETGLYFCPQSSRSQKMERLESLFSRLKLPDRNDFPENAVVVEVESD